MIRGLLAAGGLMIASPSGDELVMVHRVWVSL